MAAQRAEIGFTFLEILFAIAVIGLASGILVTNLGRGMAIQLSHAAGEVAAELEYTSQRAVARGRAQRWVVDLDAQRFRIEEHTAEVGLDMGPPSNAEQLDLSPPMRGDSFEPITSGKLGSWRELGEAAIGIDELRVSGESALHGEAVVTFAADGGADPAEIWLLDPDGHEIMVRVVAFTGEVRVVDASRD